MHAGLGNDVKLYNAGYGTSYGGTITFAGNSKEPYSYGLRSQLQPGTLDAGSGQYWTGAIWWLSNNNNSPLPSSVLFSLNRDPSNWQKEMM